MRRAARDLGGAALLGLLAHASALGGCHEAAAPPALPRSAAPPAEAPTDDLAELASRLTADPHDGDAMRRALQRYADAHAADKRDANGPHVKAVLDVILEPLVGICVGDRLQGDDRSRLIRLIAETGDARAQPCLEKTLQDYRPDTNEEDVLQVLRAATRMRLTSLAPQVMRVFKTIEHSRPKARPLRRDMIKALTALVDTSHEDELIALLGAPFDPQDRSAAFNQAFWQDGAARALGASRSAKAARPLLQLLLTPSKGPLHNAALIALVKIGDAAVPPAAAVLQGQDRELVAYSTDEQIKSSERDSGGKIPERAKKDAARAHIAIAAQVLGALGSERAIQPLLAALDAAAGDVRTRVVIAVSLPQLPHLPATKLAYRKVVEGLTSDSELQGRSARELLASSAGDFFDPGFTPWLVKTSTALKGKSDDVDPARAAAFVAAIKIMTAAQVAEVAAFGSTRAYRPHESDDKKQIATTIDEAFRKELELAKAVLASCRDDASCYLAAVALEDNQKLERQFSAIKAVYMVGVLGKAEQRDQLIELLPRLTSAAVRQTALKAIEHLTPNGDVAVADKLQGLHDDAEKRGDDRMMVELAPLVQTAARLRARLPERR